jgi:sugar transport system substrate-binding protein
VHPAPHRPLGHPAEHAKGDRDRKDHEHEQRPRHRRARLAEAFLARARALAVAGDEVLAGVVLRARPGRGIQVGAASQRVDLIGQNSQGDAARESSFMTALVGSKVDAIIMSPVSDTGSVPLVRQAADAGIPVVCYNTCLSGDAARKFVKALVTTDQVKMGEQVGNLSARYFHEKQVKAPLVAILNCDAYEACRQRKAGFKKALSAKVPGVRYVADQTGFLTDEAPATAAHILTSRRESTPSTRPTRAAPSAR